MIKAWEPLLDGTPRVAREVYSWRSPGRPLVGGLGRASSRPSTKGCRGPARLLDGPTPPRGRGGESRSELRDSPDARHAVRGHATPYPRKERAP